MDRKKLLYILLAVLGLSILYRVATTQEDKRVPLKYKTGSVEAARSPKTLSKDEMPRIELAKLKSVKRGPPADGVNLFYPFFIKAELPKPQQPPPIQPPPLDPVEEELKLFHFMGFLEKQEAAGRDKKFFLAKGQNIYIVKSGDTIEGRFKVDVRPGIVEIVGVDSEKRITIPVEEK